MLTQLLQALSEPLCIEPTMGARLVSVFARKVLHGERFDGRALHAELGVAMPGERGARPAAVGSVAVIPIHGVIAHRPQSMGTSVMDIREMVAQARASQDVVGVLYDHDSPGGEVTGVPELAADIRALAAEKPSLALANGMMASASLWLGAAAGEVWVTPSGQGAGSIGVWTAHEDWSAWFAKEGIAVTEMTAGKFKTEGAPWKPLTPEAQQFIQARVDEVYAWFISDVAADRKDTPANVRGGYGEGRVLPGKLAVKANLADKVGTFEEAVARVLQRASKGKRGPSAAKLRAELDLAAARLIA